MTFLSKAKSKAKVKANVSFLSKAKSKAKVKANVSLNI